ncbi:MAG: hypothetical protein AEth_00608 [Candidatus Argoarchaeum ethanivorans]|uniref:Pyrrolo-quinoline quinone repeat domain-containing protein n=1 Tax=Candidatus Argoarchaeum ethanivorans TaxID=2608793 RepID=A0A8B3S6L7_9EURY|nr:MAG: hypothetical protein AEth_00608 [Candidatus Argoarchaeum ethanivorans]
MKIGRTIIFVLLIALVMTPAALADYPMFGLDPGRTGNASGNAPLADMILWETKLGESYIGCGASVVSGRVYVSNWPTMGASSGIGLYCLDESDGSLIWNNTLGGNGGVSTPAISGDRVFAGSVGPYGPPGPDDPTTGDLYCIDATTGATIWNISLEHDPQWFGLASSPLIYDDKVYVVSWSDGILHAIDFDGSELWNYSASGSSNVYMSAATDGSKLFFGGGNAMNCVDITNHTKVWRFNVGDSEVSTTPAVHDGIVYFATGKPDKKLYAVNTTTGTLVWSRYLYGSLSSPAISNGRIYIGDKDKKMNCINAIDGSEVWNQTLNGACRSSPVVADGMVYTAANNAEGTIYCFDADDGTLIWSYDTNDYNMAQPSVSDGILYMGSDTGYLYAFSNIVWDGKVKLTPGTVNVTADNSGKEYIISSTCTMYSLVKAAEAGGFNYSISDAWYDDYDGALYVDMINDRHESGWDGWLYRVNYPNEPSPPSPNFCELDNGDLVTWYWGSGMGATPDNSDMLIQIEVTITERGDLNCDGAVTAADAAIALMMTVGAVPAADVGDMNGDCRVTSLDALMILQCAIEG